MCCIFFPQLLSDACDAELVSKLMLPTIVNMGKDQVANVRFNVAKTLHKLGEKLDQRSVSVWSPLRVMLWSIICRVALSTYTFCITHQSTHLVYLEYLLLSFDSRLFLGCESVGCGSSGGLSQQVYTLPRWQFCCLVPVHCNSRWNHVWRNSGRTQTSMFSILHRKQLKVKLVVLLKGILQSVTCIIYWLWLLIVYKDC